MRAWAVLTAALLAAAGAAAEGEGPRHGVSIHGEPSQPPNFAHFGYVDPAAPKGGDLRLSAIGGFDSLNPFVLKGTPGAGLAYVFDTLLESSQDEASTSYGLLAESLEMPADRSWTIFNLRPQARFQDRTPVTAEDVKFSFELLRDKGHPRFRAYWADVAAVEVLSPHRVKFSFKGGNNREMPVIIGQLPVLPKARYSQGEFDRASLDLPLGSGPYTVDRFEAGRHIVLRRDPDYWGKDIPVNRGRYNLDTVRFDYYRDQTVTLEAFKAGEYDIRVESSASMWATGYDFPAARDGLVKREAIPNALPNGMQGYVFNQRKDTFKDPRVRQALTQVFDFEWSNKTLFHEQYKRSASWWSNSELAARGLPQGEELTTLQTVMAQHPGALPPETLTTEYNPPVTDGSGSIRPQIREALRLLKDAGWEIKDGRMTNVATGARLEFEILLNSPLFERITLPYKANLERIGVVISVRTVEPAQYQRRLDTYDFDVIVDVFGASLSPGNELRGLLRSDRVAAEGGENYAGIANPAIDALVELVIAAPDRASLVQRTRALDRALQWGHYVVPMWHYGAIRVAYWDKFGHPATAPKYGLGMPDTWWFDPAKAARLPRR